MERRLWGRQSGLARTDLVGHAGCVGLVRLVGRHRHARHSGHVYRGTAAAEALGGSRVASAVLAFYGSSGQILDTAWGQAATASTAGWISLPLVVGLAPTGTVSVAVGIVDWDPGNGAQLLIDTASLNALPDSVPP